MKVRRFYDRDDVEIKMPDANGDCEMNYFNILITLLMLLPMLLPAKTQKLPSIESLKELPVEIAADFMNHDEIASPAMPVIAKDGIIFFYDVKLKKVFKTYLDNHTLVPLSRHGEGPKEYIYILDMLIHGEYIYMIDSKQKLLCFGLDGEYKWEKKTDIQYKKIAAKKGNTFYLVGLTNITNDSFFDGIFELINGQQRRLLAKLPLLHMNTSAIIDGKFYKGKGIFFTDEPIFCKCKDLDILITSANTRYQFNILNIKGELVKTIRFDSPSLELRWKKKKYAIMDIFCEPPFIIVISNYFKADKPRVDFFTMNGTLKKSFLMPLQVDAKESIYKFGKRSVEISNGYLLYKDIDEVGFKVYRLSN